ncbi:MAG: response regulator [Myxococcota bacterium]
MEAVEQRLAPRWQLLAGDERGHRSHHPVLDGQRLVHHVHHRRSVGDGVLEGVVQLLQDVEADRARLALQRVEDARQPLGLGLAEVVRVEQQLLDLDQGVVLRVDELRQHRLVDPGGQARGLGRRVRQGVGGEQAHPRRHPLELRDQHRHLDALGVGEDGEDPVRQVHQVGVVGGHGLPHLLAPTGQLGEVGRGEGGHEAVEGVSEGNHGALLGQQGDEPLVGGRRRVGVHHAELDHQLLRGRRRLALVLQQVAEVGLGDEALADGDLAERPAALLLEVQQLPELQEAQQLAADDQRPERWGPAADRLEDDDPLVGGQVTLLHEMDDETHGEPPERRSDRDGRGLRPGDTGANPQAAPEGPKGKPERQRPRASEGPVEVMLVDDSRVMRQLVRRTLRQAGYDVKTITEAEHGKDALDKLASSKPDLVLSDWNMPTMNGIDLLVALREQGNEVPLGFVTSESTPAMKARAAGAGALFLLTKPFTADDLREALSTVGIRPHGEGGGGRRMMATPRVFGDRLLSQLFTTLVNVEVTLKPGPRLVAAVTPSVAAAYIDDDDQLLYGGFCELSVAAAMGAALGLRPATAVAEMLRQRELPEALQADVREVFNVMARTFNDCNSVHVRLRDISFPPAQPETELRRLDRKAAARQDYQVKVAGYGTGKLSLFSRAPEFLLTPVLAEVEKG